MLELPYVPGNEKCQKILTRFVSERLLGIMREVILDWAPEELYLEEDEEAIRQMELEEVVDLEKLKDSLEFARDAAIEFLPEGFPLERANREFFGLYGLLKAQKEYVPELPMEYILSELLSWELMGIFLFPEEKLDELLGDTEDDRFDDEDGDEEDEDWEEDDWDDEEDEEDEDEELELPFDVGEEDLWEEELIWDSEADEDYEEDEDDFEEDEEDFEEDEDEEDEEDEEDYFDEDWEDIEILLIKKVPEPDRSYILDCLKEMNAGDEEEDEDEDYDPETVLRDFEDLRCYREICFWDDDFLMLDHVGEGQLIDSPLGEALGLGKRQDQQSGLFPWELEEE